MKVEANSKGVGTKLAYAILVYQQADTYERQGSTFMTKHPVHLFGDKPMIMPGMPMTDKDYDTFVTEVTKRSDIKEPVWNDPCVLAKTPDKVIWWNPPAMQSMFFKTANAAGKQMTFSGVCKIPGLVFMTERKRKSLAIYAVRGKDRPTPETTLYQAPFHNVYQTGSVCIGNGARPSDDHWDDINAWVRMFFASRFTHVNIDVPERLIKGYDIADFWEEQIKNAAKTFPEKVLVKLKIQVQNLLPSNSLQKIEEMAEEEGED